MAEEQQTDQQQAPMPVPQSSGQPPIPNSAHPDIAQNVMPIAQQAQQLNQGKPGVSEAQMGQAPKAQPTEGPSKKRIILSVLGAAAGLGPMVQQINQKHNQDQQIRNQHVIDTVWGSHNNETQARNRINELKPHAEQVQQMMKEVQALPDSDPTKVGRMGFLAHTMQDITKEITQQAQIVQQSQTNLSAILADPKNRKIMSKAVGYDEKLANTPERQQMIQAIQKSVPGTSPQEAQMESQFPQGSSQGQAPLPTSTQNEVLKLAGTQASVQAKMEAPPKETTDTRARADFDAFKKQNPGYSGTFESWKTEQSAIGRTSQNRDDRNIAINQKRAMGQPLTPDEKAYQAAYDVYIKQTKVDPRVAGAVASGANRYIQVINPNDPEQVTLMRAADAARAGANTPASIGFQTDKAITRYMTSGAGGANITAFNTTTEHLNTLQDAAKALQNGDVQAFNSLGNKWATATGMPAPTDFNAVKFAVAGELSKTFKGAGATDAEISQINQTINTSQSPPQIQGAIDFYKRLMSGKLSALQSQYSAGKSGQPAFKAPEPPKGATQVGHDAQGKVVGWMVNGKWVDAK
jgi:hypothetical protein